MVVAEKVYNISNIVMIWELNEACVGHFHEIFRPLENVTFITAGQQHLFEKNAVAQMGPSYANFLEILRRFHLETVLDQDWHTLRREKYRLFIPVSFVLHEVFQFVKNHNACHCISVHVRHTDLDNHYSVASMNHSSNLPFFQFIDAHSSRPCVYLMTDNPITQHIFLKRYGSSRLLVYDIIRDTSVHQEANHRFTSLFHTLVDVLIAAHAAEFLGSRGSSLSQLVPLLNVTLVSLSDFYTSCRSTRGGREAGLLVV
jgi:hypothetical protein